MVREITFNGGLHDRARRARFVEPSLDPRPCQPVHRAEHTSAVRTQESVRELAGLVRGPACHPAKDIVLSTAAARHGAVSAMCTSMATGRPCHLDAASLHRRRLARFLFDARCPALAWPHTYGRVLALACARSAGAPVVNPTAQRPRSILKRLQHRLPLRRVSGSRPKSHRAGVQRQ